MSTALAIAITFALTKPINSWAGVGKVTEQTGPTEIVRNAKSVPSTVNSSIEMNDTVVTARARAMLTFDDNTTVKITEQSKLVIDDFVYDPKKGTGKLALKVAMGTARYASGQIAKNDPQHVNVKTPTATIAVRGTDFSMTVDELGRSLIMLLPSCNKNSCVTGAIEVSNEAGSVMLTQAYQATLVTSLTSPPTSAVIITIDQLNINNMLIIAPPKELVDEKVTNQKEVTALDFNFLNKDYLKFDELEKDHLESTSLLDRNELDNELLGNALDASNQALYASQEAMLEQNTMLPGYTAASGLKYTINAETDKLVLTRASTHNFELSIPKEQGITLDLKQDGVPVYQRTYNGGTTTITVTQR